MKGAFKELAARAHIAFMNRREALLEKMRDQKGAGTVEYALVIAVIVVMIIGAALLMQGPLEEFFKGVVDKIKQVAGV